MEVSVCAGCGCILRRGRTFSFKVLQNEASKCLLCSMRHWPMLRRSLLTAFVVGAVLSLLNHGDVFVSGSWEKDLYWKVPLTYCVPFLVASWGALTNTRR